MINIQYQHNHHEILDMINTQYQHIQHNIHDRHKVITISITQQKKITALFPSHT